MSHGGSVSIRVKEGGRMQTHRNRELGCFCQKWLTFFSPRWTPYPPSPAPPRDRDIPISFLSPDGYGKFIKQKIVLPHPDLCRPLLPICLSSRSTSCSTSAWVGATLPPAWCTACPRSPRRRGARRTRRYEANATAWRAASLPAALLNTKASM